jgi:hypothetical protein
LIGDKDVTKADPGHHVVVLDEFGGHILKNRHFSTSQSVEAAENLNIFLKSVRPHRIVIMNIHRDGRYLSEVSDQLLKSVGVSMTDYKKYESTSVIGVKGIFGPSESGNIRRIKVRTRSKSNDWCLAGNITTQLVTTEICDIVESQLWSAERDLLVHVASGLCMDTESWQEGALLKLNNCDESIRPHWDLQTLSHRLVNKWFTTTNVCIV